MTDSTVPPPPERRTILNASQLGALLAALQELGFEVHGPAARDGAIVVDKLADATDLPHGLTVTQAPGHFRLQPRNDAAVFGFTHGADSWKKLLHPPRARLWSAARDGDSFTVTEDPAPSAPYALFGVRACDLHAIAVQDKVLQDGPYVDGVYAARRAGAFIIAADCASPSGTCFCTSMGDGPAASGGYDLALTELSADDPAKHRFVVRAASERGAAVVAQLALPPATEADLADAAASEMSARAQMGRCLDAGAARATLAKHRESAHWQDVAQRCLSCGNCTMVCPTCFCTTVEDSTDLNGDIAERWQRWDSCFTFGFSYTVGGPVRESPGARYRHWISHKLLNWHDQFGESGCTGCGRCITWCPVGIDITAEIAALQQDVS